MLDAFFSLSIKQKNLISKFAEYLKEWNFKINLISRKDIDNIYLHHILYSLSIAKIINFDTNTRIIDIGTGGGFPGIPLSIIFPNSYFYLLDSIKKKTDVLLDIIGNLELENVKIKNIRSENYIPEKKFDFIVGRGVSSINKFYDITKHLISNRSFNTLPNGIIYLTGGEIEYKNLDLPLKVFNIYDFFPYEYFKTKKIIYLQCNK